MIERIVLVKLRDDAGAGVREGLARRAREVMPGVAGVVGVSVGEPGDEASAGSWDLSIVVRLASAADLPAYAADAAHRAFVDDELAPRMEIVKAWNFEVPEPAGVGPGPGAGS